MSENKQRVFDKINYETNVVDPKTFAVLLRAVENNQPLSYEKGRDVIFPQARANAGMQWNPSKVDTHASGTLEQYCLVIPDEKRTIKVSDLGYEFLSCFDDKYNICVPDEKYKYVLLKMIFAWHETDYGRNIHPGRILIKLLLDAELNNQTTNHEFALWTSNTDPMSDEDYDNIKQMIIEYRKKPYLIPQKKAEVFLRPFANSWGLFESTIANGTYTFKLKDSTRKIALLFFINMPSNKKKYQFFERIKGGFNKIYYGAPGCGKSFLVNKYLDEKSVSKENRIRVTFHPEYANCDFVGQILPTIEEVYDEETGETKENVKYVFNPGPFTLALLQSYKTGNMVYLIIEEINRGNAAAIFGDLFQLLDRKEGGESEYPICNPNIQKYLEDELKKEGIEVGEINELVIPSNLSIIATMNSSDQNVFTLDTAFKRRWSFVQISNDITKDTTHEYKNWYVPGTNVTWEKFLTVINDEIIKNRFKNQTNEDKRLGKYFVSKSCLTQNVEKIEDVKEIAESFAYKILEYIWNDVCKIGKEDWFDVTTFKTLEDLVFAFVNPDASKGETPLSVFYSISF